MPRGRWNRRSRNAYNMVPSRSMLYVVRDWVVDSVKVMQAKLRLRSNEEERVVGLDALSRRFVNVETRYSV